MESVTVTIGDRTATYATPAEAVESLLAALPRNQRGILWWMDRIREINQREAGIKPVLPNKPDAALKSKE